MNKFYIIIPVVLLGGFIFIHNNFSKELEVKVATKKALEQKEIERKAADKKAAEEKAKQEAIQRDVERKEEERKAEEDKKKKHQDNVDKLQGQINGFKSESAKFAAELAAKEKKLAELRELHSKATREVFDLSKKVEAAKVLVRNAELEIQRYTEMVSRKAAESSMTKAPTVASNP